MRVTGRRKMMCGRGIFKREGVQAEENFDLNGKKIYFPLLQFWLSREDVFEFSLKHTD
jgi:hypothetical protein